MNHFRQPDTRAVGSIDLARVLDADVARDWDRQLAWTQLDQLNGTFVALGFADDESPVSPEQCDRLGVRVRDLATCARWGGPRWSELAFEYVRARVEHDEDAFGPALVLSQLGTSDPAAQAWLATVPPRVSAALSGMQRSPRTGGR